MSKENEVSRAQAWDAIGDKFWKIGRDSARPNHQDLNTFLLDIPAGAKVAVIGASTKYLIEEAVNRGINVTVFDFSSVMLGDLEKVMGNSVVYKNYDILTNPPDFYINGFDFVLSDRLVNRFTKEEAVIVYSNMFKLINKTGIVCNTVKLGLYKMDKRLFEYADEHNLKKIFFDEKTNTINFKKAEPILNECIVEHGEIPKDILHFWYLGRGKESRFFEKDIYEIIGLANGSFLGESSSDTDDETKFFRAMRMNEPCVE